jgi:hypothetical protein
MMAVTGLDKHVGSKEEKGSSGTLASSIIICYKQQLLKFISKAIILID